MSSDPASVNRDVNSRWTSSELKISTADQIFRDAGLRMRIATEADTAAIAQFLKNTFERDEPLSNALKNYSSDEDKNFGPSPLSEEFFSSCFVDNLSIICESIDNSFEGIAALSLCRIIERSDEGKLSETLATQGPLEPLPEKVERKDRFERIIRLVDTVIAEADVFGRMPELDRLIDITILSVHPAYRQKKIAIGLCDKIREMAIEKGIYILRVICTSHFSARATSRLGYECIHSFSYSDFKDSQGNQIFNTEPPHNAVTTYILNLRNKSSWTQA